MAYARRSLVGLVSLLSSAVWLPAPVAAQATTVPACPAGATSAFDARLQPLAAWLGNVIGRPGCGRADPTSGDLLQPTSTGLAYVRAATGAPVFTDGAMHWAVLPDGAHCWVGGSAYPPPAPADALQLTTVGSTGQPDPWVAGLTLAASIQPQPYSVSADDVLSALAQRCLPVAAQTMPSPPGVASETALTTLPFVDRRAGATPGWIGVFVSPFLAERAAAQNDLVEGNVVVHPPSGLSSVQHASYATALAAAAADTAGEPER